MLLLPEGAPLATQLSRVLPSIRGLSVRAWCSRTLALGAVGTDDLLDDAVDPSINVAELRTRLDEIHLPPVTRPAVERALLDREDVLALGVHGAPDIRPPTMFELDALADVLGVELAARLGPDDIYIERAQRPAGALNDCTIIEGRARIRLVSTNGRTLAGRTHALVHELGHALIGVAKVRGVRYGAEYGQVDYGRFLTRDSWGRPCDEEALVRAIADAWLLRRTRVTWTRSWPGAIDEPARTLDGDSLARWARERLKQGLGLHFTPVDVASAIG